MTTKHTAGEWIDRGTSCVGTHRKLVASVYPMPDENPEEHAANMRLIAAAPEMLLALQTIARKTWHRGTAMLHEEEMILVTQAIARATGDQP